MTELTDREETRLRVAEQAILAEYASRLGADASVGDHRDALVTDLADLLGVPDLTVSMRVKVATTDVLEATCTVGHAAGWVAFADYQREEPEITY